MKNLLLLFILGISLSIQAAEPIPFTLRNTSLKDIYLEIPGVMNPNLSPFSNSGVSLEEGQQVYFLHKGERYLLLKVTTDYQGKTIKVPALIKQRKKALKLK